MLFYNFSGSPAHIIECNGLQRAADLQPDRSADLLKLCQLRFVRVWAPGRSITAQLPPLRWITAANLQYDLWDAQAFR